MYLKKIELQGFKSFHGKMQFTFDKGVTAIVGPNGSGKSNVADAVRWVLGEQSAKLLRGSKMQDVIFAGTEMRKALSFCEVSLCIGNDDHKLPIDYDEVTVTRRVYRSGESEYYINGASCRMRDIHELFMDTGVGREGYSIIGQGQIDKILSNKPEQRRGLFDEAAGIVKYKKRKETALKKLEEEKQNLYRISDIVSELEDRHVVLEEKADKARKFIEYKEALKVREVKQFVDQIDELESKLAEESKLHRQVADEIKDVNASLEKNDESHKEVGEKAEANLSELDELAERLLDLNEKKNEDDKNKSLLAQRIEHIGELVEKNKAETLSYEEKLGLLKDELKEYKTGVTEVFNKSEEAGKNIEEKTAELAEIELKLESKNDELAEYRANIIEELNKLSSLKSERQHFYTTSKTSDDRKASILARKLVVEGTGAEHNKNYELLKGQIDENNKQIKDLEAKIVSSQNKRISLKNKLSKCQDDYQDIKSELAGKKSKQAALYDLLYSYEGFNYSIKKVMELKGDYAGQIFGVVTDLIKVKSEYETAIEIALGSSYQNIIISSSDVGKKLIDYLKKNRFGRATFLPLDTIKFYDNRQDLSHLKGFIGYGDELVSYDEKYDDIIKSLLAKTVIAEDLDVALSMRKRDGVRLRIVTLAGDVLNAGGSMTGGEYKNKGNRFLARKREYEESEKFIKDLESRLVDVVREAKQVKSDLEAMSSDRDDLQEEMRTLKDRASELSVQAHKLDTDLLRDRSELSEIESELRAIEDGILSHDTAIKEVDEKIADRQAIIDKLEKDINDTNSFISENTKLREEKLEKLQAMKLESTRLFEQRTSSEQHIARMEAGIAEVVSKIELLARDMRAYLEDIKVKEEQMKGGSTSLGEIDEEIAKTKARQKEVQTQKTEYKKLLDKIYEERENFQKTLSNLEKEEIRLSNKIERISQTRSDSYDYMWSSYELTYSECKRKYDTLSKEDFVNIKKEIRDLKAQLKELGDVDVNSIDEFVEVSERFKFLSEQKEDIEATEEKLNQMIAELDKLMTEQFNESFKKINAEFSKVFKSLFGGGKAYLELSGGSDILDAGIEINVQPPGKKLQSMMLLSGGERAFTAIALLFSILNLKPTPFCVLDEIEAALDDTNVVKFAQYLKKISKTMQFIVITHRRGTMENSDSLYGITMQEKGISKQVSVKLIDEILD